MILGLEVKIVFENEELGQGIEILCFKEIELIEVVCDPIVMKSD